MIWFVVLHCKCICASLKWTCVNVECVCIFAHCAALHTLPRLKSANEQTDQWRVSLGRFHVLVHLYYTVASC